MEYKLHRVARNSEGWVRPSPGRLGANDVGSYVRERGFGHEDWNFNYDFAFNGKMLGYTVAQPAARFVDQEFGVILATYDPLGWKAVGYYNGARFQEIGRYPATVLRKMAVDVSKLAEQNSVSKEFRNKTLLEMQQQLGDELVYHRWVTPKERVVAFKAPVIIPQNIFNPGVQRMHTPFNIARSDFEQIINLGTSTERSVLLEDIAEITNDETIDETVCEVLVNARLGQGQFRDKLLQRWGNACAATGCTVREILRASHIQSWSDSTNAERLNPANGLLLVAHLDALFDKHLISFNDDGSMLIAPSIDDRNRRVLRIPQSLRKSLRDREKRFLAKHRSEGQFTI